MIDEEELRIRLLEDEVIRAQKYQRELNDILYKMQKRNKILSSAMNEIMKEDGPGADLSPPGPCHEIAKKALKRAENV